MSYRLRTHRQVQRFHCSQPVRRGRPLSGDAAPAAVAPVAYLGHVPPGSAAARASGPSVQAGGTIRQTLAKGADQMGQQACKTLHKWAAASAALGSGAGVGAALAWRALKNRRYRADAREKWEKARQTAVDVLDKATRERTADQMQAVKEALGASNTREVWIDVYLDDQAWLDKAADRILAGEELPPMPWVSDTDTSAES